MQFLGKTYVNLGEFEKAQTLFAKTLDFAEAGHYTQIKARALSGLAEIQLKRSNFTSALVHYEATIDLLDKIGAKCDLANAYLQLGLTYQQMHQVSDSQQWLGRSQQLFTEIQAPRQVKRVNRLLARDFTKLS